MGARRDAVRNLPHASRAMGVAGGVAGRSAVARLVNHAWAAVRAEKHRQGDLRSSASRCYCHRPAGPLLVRLGFREGQLGTSGDAADCRLYRDACLARSRRHLLLGVDSGSACLRWASLYAQGPIRPCAGGTPHSISSPMSRVLLIVGGGIAAYKAAEL